MYGIVFVCHGNICRSPMAEFILRDILEKSDVPGNFIITSRAVSDEEIHRGVGAPVYPPAAEELAKHGIDCRGKRAQKLSPAEYGSNDLIVCMDAGNVREARRIFGGDPEKKIRRMMDFTTRPGNVADPWYSGRFDITYRDIREACEGIAAYIVRNRIF
ncbi:MAG: low molecular weight protein-tyrosine-phosphatase [Eubacteriales bacterium]|nr:low molecular weight phosphotyrosine protein phosphatase [Clostridiales bacterium]MDD7301884.1 low molecular weight phosphotyrosine protein phosphatase [Eubacteriales bacterium]MDY4433890.1 low molecular weight protein-tyrosine-phosphatase [Candidatus Flemingibacterium sp.]